MDKTAVSKQISYWLRHDPEGLEMDEEGYVDLDELLEKLRERFPEVDRELVEEINGEGKRRYEIKDGRMRAIYGHSIEVDLGLPEDEEVEEVYHGTTSDAAYRILRNGLKPKDRNMVHLSATKDIAEEVGKRRTEDPVILRIGVESAREDGLKFYRATDEIYLSEEIPPKFIEKIDQR
ncbi:MAG: RNA 2'-phosphotransferase [Candidatus Aenigmatarchaeota archaeon]